jgi:hypothetical protein
MEIKKRVTATPQSKTCGETIYEWLIKEEEAGRYDSAAERIANALISGIKKDFEKIKQTTAK